MPEERNTRDTSNTKGEIPRNVWIRVWAALELSRLVHDGVSSQTSEFWRRQCTNLSHQALLEGSKRATNFDGKLTLGKFKEMCFENKPRNLMLNDKPDEKRLIPKADLRELIAKMRKDLAI